MIRTALRPAALLGCFLAGSLSTGLVAGLGPWQPLRARDAVDAAQAPSPPAPPAPGTPAQAPGAEYEPVLHARKAGIRTCMDSVVAQSRRVIDARHSALSVWNTHEPDRGLFQSILALTYDNGLAPNGAAILTAAPNGPDRCGGTFVQIYPTALSCTAIQADLLKSGKPVAALLDMPVVATSDGTRDLLMPAPGGGCVIVATHLN